MRNRLMFMLFFMVATTLMGIGVVAVLAAGMGDARNVILASAIGFVLALPVTWLVTRKITDSVVS